MSKETEEIEKSLQEAPAPAPVAPAKLSRRDLLSTGSTLVNLACSDNPYGGFLKGKYYFIVGDSASGKTFFSMSCFAEATLNHHFKGYRFIYDNIEDGCLIDLEKMFNEEVADRMEPPVVDENGEPIYSSTLEEFYYHLEDIIKEGKPFIYVLDSMDALTSEQEEDKFDEQKKAFEKGTQTAGSYGDGKAKINSSHIRRVIRGVRETGSILIILCQTRDNLGFGFEKKTRSGGRALKFYATVELWTTIIKSIKKKVMNKDREIGVRIEVQVKKNRITGRRLSVEVAIYPSYGIDDTTSCIEYLVSEGWWKVSKQKIEATEFNKSMSMRKLIQYIEANGLLPQLRAIVGSCWAKVQEECSLRRKKRYE